MAEPYALPLKKISPRTTRNGRRLLLVTGALLRIAPENKIPANVFPSFLPQKLRGGQSA